MRDLTSPTRDLTHAPPCNGTAKSTTGSPGKSLYDSVYTKYSEQANPQRQEVD